MTLAREGEGTLVSWPSVTNRLYDLWWTTDLVSDVWEQVAGQTNLPGTGGFLVYTNLSGSAAARFFRPGVRLP